MRDRSIRPLFRRASLMCRLIPGMWWPRYYRGQNGRMWQVHPFRRAAPCFIASSLRNPLAAIRRRQMKERIHAMAAPKSYRSWWPTFSRWAPHRKAKR